MWSYSCINRQNHKSSTSLQNHVLLWVLVTNLQYQVSFLVEIDVAEG